MDIKVTTWGMREIDLEDLAGSEDGYDWTTLDVADRLELVLQLRELQEPVDERVRCYAV